MKEENNQNEHMDWGANFESGHGKHEEYERVPVPKEHRKSLATMILIMAGFAIFSGTIWVGADIASSFDIWGLIGIAVTGNLILTIYICFLGYLGGEHGLSTHELGRRTFGGKGFWLSSTMPLIAQLGWFGVGVGMFVGPIMSVMFHSSYIDDVGLLGQSVGYQLTYWVLILTSGALMICTAFLGVQALKWVSVIGVPLVLVFGFVMMILAPHYANNHGGWNPSAADGDYTSMYAIGLVFATFSSGGTLAPDFVRWAKNGRDAVIAVVIAFLTCSTAMVIFGAFAFYGTGSQDVSDALFLMGLGIPAFFVLGSNIWTTNDNGLYTQGLSASSMTGLPKRTCVVIFGTIATISTPILSAYFIPFLDLLNLTLPGIGIILILNGYIYKDDYSERTANWSAITAWIVGLTTGYFVNAYGPEFILPLYVMIFTGIYYGILHFIEVRFIDGKLNKKEIKNEQK